MLRNKELVLSLLLVATAVGVFCMSRAYTSLLYCEVIVPFLPNTSYREKLLSCSNIEQALEITDKDNLQESDADAPGWRKLTPKDPARDATVRLVVLKDRSELLFYPRVSGEQSSVSVLQPGDGWPRPLFRLQGQAGVWSPIGRQFMLRTTCLDNECAQGYTVRLEIVLKGEWAQLWIQDGKVFF